jgi:hypothetical protein
MQPGKLLVCAAGIVLGLITSISWAYTPVYPLYVEGPETLRPEKTIPQANARNRNIVLRYGYREQSWGMTGTPAKDARSGDRTPELTATVLVYDPKDNYNSYGGPVFAAFDRLSRGAAQAAYKGQYYTGSPPPASDIRLLGTDVKESEYTILRNGQGVPKKPALIPLSDRHYLDVLETTPPSTNRREHYKRFYSIQIANVLIEITDIWAQGSPRTFPDVKAVAEEIVGKVTGKPGVIPAGPAIEPEAAAAKPAPEPAAPDIRLEAFPIPAGVRAGATTIIPASTKLPARLNVLTRPGTEVTFEIASGGDAVLRAGQSSGRSVKVKAGGDGVATSHFYYTGSHLDQPLNYEVRASVPGRRDVFKVSVGLGLAFDRIVAVKGDMADVYPFTMGVKSRFHPDMRMAAYLFSAQQSGVWGDLRLGIRLRTTWVNAPGGTTPDESFEGTTKIVAARVGDNVLAVARNTAPGKPQYFLTDYMYPAVVMKSDGKHAYRINGGLVLLGPDDEQPDRGFIEEGMQQGQALVVVSKDSPEHWLTSLACSLEVTSTEQYVMLETAKMLPGGEAVDALTTVTGLMCKFGKSEYESLFYDLGTILGGKYLDRLKEPEIFEQLSATQKRAVNVAKKSYDELDEYKKKEERDKWLSGQYKVSDVPAMAPAPNAAPAGDVQNAGDPPATQPAAPPATDPLKALQDLQKPLQDLKNLLDGIFKR